MIGRIIGVIITSGAGVIIAVMGWLIWKKEKISLLHDYHYEKVSQENKKAYCTLSGLGVFLVGSGILVSGVIVAFTDSTWGFLAFAVGFAAGIPLNITAQCRYNR